MFINGNKKAHLTTNTTLYSHNVCVALLWALRDIVNIENQVETAALPKLSASGPGGDNEEGTVQYLKCRKCYRRKRRVKRNGCMGVGVEGGLKRNKSIQRF